MKRALLLLVTASLFSFIKLNAQCPGGPDPLCWNTSGPCGVLNDGVVGQPYNDTITFFAPPRVDASQQSGGLFDTLDFIQFVITNVSGLPTGLTWSCDNGSCVYDPQPNGVLCGLLICGTPVIAGTYNITVHTVGTVDTPIGPQSGNEDFNLTLVITLAPGANPGFTLSQTQGCDTASINFGAIIDAPLPQITTWDWDLGNGNTYSGQYPPTQFYPAPGDYVVACTTNIFNMVLFDFSTTATNNWWCGDVEEPNWPVVGCTAAPDLYFNFTHGSSTYTSSSGSDNTTEYWGGINEILTSTSVGLSVWDYDPTSADDDGGTWSGSVTAPGVYGYNTSSPWGGGTSGSFTILAQLDTVIIVTDTVHIHPLPNTTNIIATDTAFCPGDSVLLYVYSGMMYEWFLNDSIPVQSGLSESYVATQPGSYTCKIIDPVTGCFIVTPPINITQHTGLPPGYYLAGIENVGGVLTSQLTGTYTYQWLLWTGSSYIVLPGPAGTQATYTPASNGTYCLIATTPEGCTDTSNCIGYWLGMDDNPDAFSTTIYPNPSTGQINLQIDQLVNDASLSVYDMVGKKVYSRFVPANHSGVLETMDLGVLRKGIYLVEVVNQDGRFTQKLILK